MLTPENTKIGFIGLGIMGNPMAIHLRRAGFSVYVYTRTKEKAQEVIDAGAIWCDSVREVASVSNVIFTIVGFPEDVRKVYLDAEGILNHAQQGTILCDMTTSEPKLAIEIADEAKKKEMFAMDAPVSGGDTGAKNASLSIMVGGEQEIFDKVLPLLEIMGKNIVYLGQAGAGQHCKMCNQIAIAGKMMGMIEALRYAKHNGLDQQQLLNAISKGAAGSWSLDHLAPRIIQGDFAPGFLIKHFVKDMKIAQNQAQQVNLSVPVLDKTIEYYQKAVSAGGENLGTQGLYSLWEQNLDW